MTVLQSLFSAEGGCASSRSSSGGSLLKSSWNSKGWLLKLRQGDRNNNVNGFALDPALLCKKSMEESAMTKKGAQEGIQQAFQYQLRGAHMSAAAVWFASVEFSGRMGRVISSESIPPVSSDCEGRDNRVNAMGLPTWHLGDAISTSKCGGYHVECKTWGLHALMLSCGGASGGPTEGKATTASSDPADSSFESIFSSPPSLEATSQSSPPSPPVPFPPLNEASSSDKAGGAARKLAQ